MRFLVLFLSLSLATAQTGGFAALEITPYGDEVFDLATNITLLSEGGEVVDRESGTVLTGERVRFREGDFVEVEGARVSGDFGVLEAPELYFDLTTQTLTASGGVLFEGAALTLSGERLTLYLEPDIAVAVGGVVGERPALEAGSLLVDLAQNLALLRGPYRYAEGPVTLSGSAESDRLSLGWREEAGETVFEVQTEVDGALLARLEPYLP